jgi:pyruvate kinase
MSMQIKRRTKIVTTLGPATDAPDVLQALVAAGADVVRVNFSHGTADDHARRIRLVREAAAQLGRDIGVLADLQGPKIRIESFAKGPVTLREGAPFALDIALGKLDGDETVVGCAYTRLPHDVFPGDTLLLNDGAIAMRVEKIAGTRIDCVVTQGGTLSNRKGINKLGGGLSAAALTDEDKINIRHAAGWDVDFIAVSFPRSAADMHEARRLVQEAGGHAQLVAKIERAEALTNLEQIVQASDAVMVARGDLGVEIGDAELPGWQKKIITASREANKMVITATQMMESMISSPIPTRAEVMDVANAVLDGTDAVMLSAETASGAYPVKVVETIVRVVSGAESHPVPDLAASRDDSHFLRIDEAVAMATAWTARRTHASAIVALTESGSSALMMSRVERFTPIYALTRHDRTRRRMALCRGVYPVLFEPSSLDQIVAVREAVEALQKRGLVQDGDRVLLTKGDFTGPGGTNGLKIVTVGQLA